MPETCSTPGWTWCGCRTASRVLIELELTEPYLFLRQELAAPDLFAETLAEMLKA